MAENNEAAPSVDENSNKMVLKEVLAEKVTGQVKWFSQVKGYGFVSRNDTKEDIFIHSSSIINKNPRMLRASVAENETLEFDVVQGTRGPETANVSGPNGQSVKGSKYTNRPRFLRGSYPRRRGFSDEFEPNFNYRRQAPGPFFRGGPPVHVEPFFQGPPRGRSYMIRFGRPQGVRPVFVPREGRFRPRGAGGRQRFPSDPSLAPRIFDGPYNEVPLMRGGPPPRGYNAGPPMGGRFRPEVGRGRRNGPFRGGRQRRTSRRGPEERGDSATGPDSEADALSKSQRPKTGRKNRKNRSKKGDNAEEQANGTTQSEKENERVVTNFELGKVQDKLQDLDLVDKVSNPSAKAIVSAE